MRVQKPFLINVKSKATRTISPLVNSLMKFASYCIGILSRNADLVVKETKVHNHKAGGILVQAKEENTVRIANSKIVFNDIVGVHFVGEDSSPNFEK